MQDFSYDDFEMPSLPKPLNTPPARLTGGSRGGYRPRPATLERSREIREVAARFIAERGLWHFSMLSLARHLQCLLPTLCYYYKRREDLITDIVLRHIETLRTQVDQAMDEAEDGSPRGELHAFARAYLLTGIADRDFHRIMLGFAGLAGPRDGQTFLKRRESLRDLVERRLTLHAPALAGKPETAHALSQSLLDTLNGAASWLEPYGVVKPAAFAAMAADRVLDEAART